jgi:predicted nucleotidyltransferase
MTGSNILELLRQSNAEMNDRFYAEVTAIYGSYARGEQSSDSDLDVLYKVKQPDKFGLLEIDGLENYIKDLLKVTSVDLVNEDYVNPIIQLEIENELMYV